jgi:hypothetical protein
LIISENSPLKLKPHMRTSKKTHLATHAHTTKPSKHKTILQTTTSKNTPQPRKNVPHP